MDLIADLSHEFLATDHVAVEISNGYADQIARYGDAVDRGVLAQVSLDSEAELETFAARSESGRIGTGECSAIACAVCRQHLLAIDDRRAITQARASQKDLSIVRTSDLVIAMINEALLTVEQADAIKADWSRNHRFTLTFESFSEFILLD
jgi:predicted nucleic acid-binding protein